MSEAIGDNAKQQLKSIVERVEFIEDEISIKREDVKDVYAEAKGHGYDVKALRHIIRLRKETPEKRAEREAILDTYMLALEML